MITDQASALSASRSEVENYLRDNWHGTEFPCLGIYLPYPDYDRNSIDNVGYIKDITGPDGAPLSLPLGFPFPRALRVKRTWRKSLQPGPVKFRLRLGPEAICTQNPFQFVIVPATLSSIDSAASDISGFDFTDIEVVDYSTDHSCGMILGKIIAKTRRKKQIVVGIVRFKNYLCHCLIELFIFILQLQDSNFLS